MPTGYTCSIEDGEITEFKDFALLCARAFGACIEMRDEPLSEPLPQELKPDTDYHDSSLASAKERLEYLQGLDGIGADADADADFRKRHADWQDRRSNRERSLARYQAMRRKVAAWEPPTSDHAGLKDFMLDQIDRSIRDMRAVWDEEPARLSGAEWLRQQIGETERAINYNTKERAAAIARAANSNEWLSALRNSLRDPVNESA